MKRAVGGRRLVRFAQGGKEGLGELEGDRLHLLDGDLFGRLERNGGMLPLGEVEVLPPVEPPHMLITMGGFLPAGMDAMPPDAVPWLLPKLSARIGGADSVVEVPAGVERLWAEVELAVIVGKTIRNASEAQALDAIFGYACINDVTAPGFLFADIDKRQMSPLLDSFRAKSPDTFAVLGPCIRTDLTESDIAAGLAMTVHVNGKAAAEGSTRRKKFPVSKWLQVASQSVTLRAGDVIALGTPCPCEVKVGDVVEVRLEGIGSLRSRLRYAGQA